MNAKNKYIITASIAIAVLALVVLLIVYFDNMKQSIRGTISSNYFSDGELTHSDTADRLGLDNTPSAEEWERLRALRDTVLNPARAALGSYIKVNCAYRSAKVNAAVGGVSNSAHVTGEAADITAGSVAKNRELFAILVKLPVDQLIWEKGGKWIHVAHKKSGNRGQLLSYDGSKYTNITNNWKNAIV